MGNNSVQGITFLWNRCIKFWVVLLNLSAAIGIKQKAYAVISSIFCAVDFMPSSRLSGDRLHSINLVRADFQNGYSRLYTQYS